MTQNFTTKFSNIEGQENPYSYLSFEVLPVIMLKM